mgnify:CR=1 FL=1
MHIFLVIFPKDSVIESGHPHEHLREYRECTQCAVRLHKGSYTVLSIGCAQPGPVDQEPVRCCTPEMKNYSHLSRCAGAKNDFKGFLNII